MNLLLLFVTTLLPLVTLQGGAETGVQALPSGQPAPIRASDAEADPYLYEVILIRAAPGRLLDLIEAYQARIAAFEEAGLGDVQMMRHSQGDQWDLFILVPMGSFELFFSEEQSRRRSEALDEAGGTGREWAAALDPLVAWRQELFAWGPDPEVVNERFASAGFYHVEMFVALPGKRGELLKQREMENEYLRAIGRPDNLVFRRAAGAEWDAFTLGFYRDLQHFAEEPSLEPGREDEAARNAGFEAASRIGTYLRTLIAYHHDTLARRVD